MENKDPRGRKPQSPPLTTWLEIRKNGGYILFNASLPAKATVAIFGVILLMLLLVIIGSPELIPELLKKFLRIQ